MGEGQQHAGMGRPREAERITGPEESESTGYVPQAIKQSLQRQAGRTLKAEKAGNEPHGGRQQGGRAGPLLGIPAERQKVCESLKPPKGCGGCLRPPLETSALAA